MAEEKRLIATIIPEIDATALKDAVSQAFQQAFNVNVNVSGAFGGGTGSGGGSFAGNAVGNGSGQNVSQGVVDADSDTMANIQNEEGNRQAANKADDVGRVSKALKKLVGERQEADSEEQKGEQQKRARQMQMISSAANQFAGAGMSLIKNSFGVLEDIYGRLKAASPLLQTIESLFNLAMTLFFMPLGNKLAEVVLPATLELVDAVVDMWDKFEGKTLSEMFEHAFTYGVGLLADYFQNIGELLQNEGGLLGSIGDLFVSIGDFIENNGVKVLDAILKITDLVISHLGTIITLIGAFYGFYIGYTMAKDALGFLGWIPGVSTVVGTAGGLVGAASGAAIGAGVSAWIGLPFAEGGHVNATPGGVPAIVGEGGEGEWIIPDSKMGSLGGVTNYFQFYGLTNEELVNLIDDRINRQISGARLRGSF